MSSALPATTVNAMISGISGTSLYQMNGVALKTAAAALIITVVAVTARIGQEISVNTEETHLLTTVNALSTGIGSMQNNDVITAKTAAPATIVTPMTARIVVF